MNQTSKFAAGRLYTVGFFLLLAGTALTVRGDESLITGMNPAHYEVLNMVKVQQLARLNDLLTRGTITFDQYAGATAGLVHGVNTSDPIPRYLLDAAPPIVLGQTTADSGNPPGSDCPPGPVPPSIGYTVGAYTYAGFEPCSVNRNLNETDPSKAAKDWVYRYLLDNHTVPNNNWAQVAADALNAQYNTDVFQPIDGETLGYGDEYVHSAPNGYGLSQGQFDPNAQGEFFWGYQ